MSRPPIVSVDVEDWPQSSWDRSLPITERSARNTLNLLEILARSGHKVTMFVLGKFAEAFPQVVREIHAGGHEIACHGFGHVEVFKQTPDEFRSDVARAKALLEDLVGEEVFGYRAPDFSIVGDSLWALQVLGELGFEYDSSVFPLRTRRYGIQGWPLSPTRVALAGGGSILELPIGTGSLAGRAWPLGGGGYFRLLPGVVSRTAVRMTLERRPFVFYCHPYEFDAREMWELDLDIPFARRLHQGLGRGRFEARFREFVRVLGAQTMRDWISENQVNEQVDLESLWSAPR